MKSGTPLAALVAALLAATGVSAQTPPAMKMTTPIPADITTPDTIESRIGTLKFNDGFPTDETVQKVYDNLAFQRGVNVFLAALPGGSTEGLRQGLASIGVDNNQTVALFEDLMDSKSLFLTANTESVYSVMWVDLKDGPVVFETPPDVLGIIDDHWFQYVADFGRVGPDKGEGGKYLLLPPGYKGDVPEGYFVYRPKTYGNLVFWRGFLKDGSTQAAVAATKKHARVYNLKDAANPPPMKFINVSGKVFNTIGANTYKFYEDIDHIVQYEPNDAFSAEILGQMAALGIEKGKKFNPDARMKKILTEAAAVGNATARTLVFKYPDNDVFLLPGQRLVPGLLRRQLQVPVAAGREQHRRDGALPVLRHGHHTGDGVEAGRQGLAIRDRSHRFQGRRLDGGKTYKVRLPPNVPAKDFWSFVVYDNQSRSMLQTDQRYPSIGNDKKGVVANPDGSVDVYFGPSAPEGHESNWVQTVPGKGWSVALRLYGPEEAWFNKTWRPGEIEPVR